MWKEVFGVMYRKTDEGYEFIKEGVKGYIIPFTGSGLRKALNYVAGKDPWTLWYDRSIMTEEFYLEITN